MIQTAEGGLEEVSGILIRLRELAEQSANETLGTAERGYLNTEFTALVSEITRVADSTEFNGTKLLDGTNASLDIQVGIGTTSASQVAIVLGTTMTAAGLSLNATTIAGADNTTALAAITALDNATALVSARRSTFGAAQNRLESTIRNIGMTVENLSAANSRIRDVDIAWETSQMTSFQILQQAGVSVLAQANSTPQMALMLLQR
jgi:flagellin